MKSNPLQGRRSHRLRSRRLRTEEINLGPLTASARHASVGTIQASVEDLSLHGMALVISADARPAQPVMNGDRLEDLGVDSAGGVIYQGSAVIKRVTERGGDLVLGVEFESAGIDLGEVYRRGSRRSFADRWDDLHRQDGGVEISPVFRAWVLDLRAYLERTRDFLTAEERRLDVEDELTRDQTLQQYLEEAAPHLVDRMNRASKELADLVRDVQEHEHPAWRAFCRTHLAPLFACSPFMRRAHEKPLGYAGDYEMMNMLYRQHAEGATLFGKALNLYATQEIAASANINRIDYLMRRLRSAATASPRGVRVASVGCGPAREIFELLERWPELGPRLDIALIDQEDRSIGYCERTLAPLATRTGARIQFIRESIRQLLGARQLSRTLGARELIYSAGLFDYLNDRSFSALLAALRDALEPGGLLAVGNVAAGNPSRHAMEYFSDWFLVHRSRDELRSLAAALTPAPASVEVDSEPLGVNLFLLVRR